MHKAVVTVLCSDRPGIVCEVSSLLSKLECNIEDISQTVIQGEFAGIFMVALPKSLPMQELDSSLKEGLPEGFYPLIKPVEDESLQEDVTNPEPFVVISIGPDRIGLIAAITCIMKDFGVNITNLQFVNRAPSFPEKTVTIYEVDVPGSIPLRAFVQTLESKAKSLGLEISVQHKKIFEDICRI